MRILITTTLATLALAGTASASDTHGCRGKIGNAYLETIATKNISCGNATRFMRQLVFTAVVCSPRSKRGTCQARQGRFWCSIREDRSMPQTSVYHCTDGKKRRIGLVVPWPRVLA